MILCTFNGNSRGFLKKALDSVLGQTAPPKEILLVNDGSTDDTGPFVREMYPSVKVLDKRNAGLPAARNTGVAAASFGWVAFLDDDDIWFPQKLEKQLAQRDTDSDAQNTLFASRMETFSTSPGPGHKVMPPLCLARWPACLISCPITGPSGVMVSKSLLQRVGPFNESLSIAEDYEYWVRCLKDGASIRYSDEVLLRYRIHPDQMTGPAKLKRTVMVSDVVLFPFIEALDPRPRSSIVWIRALLAVRALIRRGRPADAVEHWKRSTGGAGALAFLRASAFLLADSCGRLFAETVRHRLAAVGLRIALGKER